MTDAPMNFAPRPSVEWSDHFEGIIDRAMQADNAAQKPRNYLGGSRLGVECSRALAFEFHRTPKDAGREFSGKILRIFKRGHDGEDAMAGWLRLAGFTVITHKKDGGQIGFKTGWSEERQSHLIAGHLDGVITAAPYESGVVCPALWECKFLGDTGWKDTVKKGVRASKPVYFAQMQTYMAYLDLTDNPALFTAVNGNTGQIYAERIPFDAAAAQTATDRGVKVVTSRDPFELPRVAATATDFRCKFCDFRETCWAEAKTPEGLPATAAGWSFGK